MAKLSISLIADVKSFLTGIGKSEDALDELSGSLDDMAADAQQAGREAGDDVARGIESGTKDATGSVDKLERSFREMARAVSKDAKQAGDDVGDEMRHGTDEASEGVDELGREAGSTARETAASFDGSAESIAGAFQEVAANAFAGFGPAGAAAGLAVAAGLGIITTTLQAAADEANALTEEAGAFALQMRDSDVSGRVELLRDRWDEVATKIADARSIWEVWQPRAVTNIERFAEAAKASGFDIQGMFDAFDDPNPVKRLENLNGVLDDTNDKIADLNYQLKNYEFGSADEQAADARATAELRRKLDALVDSRDALKDEVDQTRAAADITEALALAAGKTVDAYKLQQDQVRANTELQAAYAAALESTADPVSVYEVLLDDKAAAEKAAAQATADATEDSKDSWEDYVTGVSVSTDELITEWNRQAAAATAFEDNLAIIAAAGGQALADELRAKGPEIAGAVAETIATADPSKQRAAIEAHARATGAEMAASMAGGLRDGQSDVQGAVDDVAAGVKSPTVKVGVDVDLTAAERSLRTWRPVVVGEFRAGMRLY